MTPEIFTPIRSLYQAMDEAYDKTASRYGFLCRGCEDNCCRSLFFHHTFVETAYLIHGFERMASEIRQKVIHRADTYLFQTFFRHPAPALTDEAGSRKQACPLNENGLCLLYPYRPMICRLHGLPHELRRPDGTVIKGPGCPAGNFDHRAYVPFDRTPFYREMARVETRFRQQNNHTGKIRLTIAQMLLNHSKSITQE